MRYSGIFRMKFTVHRAVAAGLATLVIGRVLSPARVTADPVACQDLSIPVSLAGLRETVYGRFCAPPQPTSTVLVLVPGGTCNGTYWDLPASLGWFPSVPG